MPKVSVVIPTHNRTQLLLTRALPSVLRQKTELDIEVLVVGDATEQSTKWGIWAMADDRVSFVDLPKQLLPEDPGQAWMVLGLDARNYGYDHVDGDYLAELDDDDMFVPGHLQTLYEAIQKADYDVAYGRSKAFDENGQHIADYGSWPPQHFAYCEGAWLSKHDLGFRYDLACIERGLPMDADRIDRMVAAGLRFTMVDQVVHFYWPNRHPRVGKSH